MVVAAHARIYKLDVDVVAHTREIAVMPDLKREGRGLATTLFHRALVVSTRRVRIKGIRLAECDVDVTAIRHPSRFAGRKVLVGIRDARIVLVAELIVR